MRKIFLFHAYIFFAITCNSFNCINYINTHTKRQDNKVYFDTKALDLTSGKIFFGDKNFFYMPLEQLSCDDCGLYVQAGDFDAQLCTVWNLHWCPNCQTVRQVDFWGKCTRCQYQIMGGKSEESDDGDE